jgi:hypothetical protein
MKWVISIGQDIFDLSAREVYIAINITANTVSSYLTFSPLFQLVRTVYFLLHFLLLKLLKRLPVKKHATLCCPDFPFRIFGTIRRPTIANLYIILRTISLLLIIITHLIGSFFILTVSGSLASEF